MDESSIDWYSWLSKTGLEPSLTYQYALSFSQNQLDEDDIPYFNHEFLQSIGISIAKHRLEILKLSIKHKAAASNPISKLINKTKRALANYIHTFLHRRNDHSALVMVKKNKTKKKKKKKSSDNSWRGNKICKQATAGTTFLLTNGGFPAVKSGGARVNSFSVPLIYNLRQKLDVDDKYGDEDIKWDTMFQNLKPT